MVSEEGNSGITSNVVLDSVEDNVIQLNSPQNLEENSNKDYKSFTKHYSLSEISLQSKDFPTEYKYGKEKQVTPNHSVIKSRNAEKGFILGKQLGFTKYELTSYSVKDLFDVTVGLYEFDSAAHSSWFKEMVQNSVEGDGGYEKIKTSTDAECFAWTEDYGYEIKIGSAICYNKNIVYWISIDLTNSFKQPRNELIKFVEIVDEKIK